MRIKALTAGFVLAAITAVSSAGHAEALSRTTVSNKKHKITKVKVDQGDSLSKIAKRHKTTYVRLYDANRKIKDPDLIFPGETIRIPSAGEKLPDRLKPAAAPPPKPAVTPAQAPAPAPKPAPAAPVVHATGSGVWYRLAQCESGGNWAINTGNGFYGGLQFTLSTWRSVGGSGYPNQASASEQIARAKILQARSGWGAWPACSARLGLR
jgi:LysM repeat protein